MPTRARPTRPSAFPARTCRRSGRRIRDDRAARSCGPHLLEHRFHLDRIFLAWRDLDARRDVDRVWPRDVDGRLHVLRRDAAGEEERLVAHFRDEGPVEALARTASETIDEGVE